MTTTVSILHIPTKLVKTPTKQPYRIDIFISLVNGLFKVTTESIKFVLDAEQSGASSDLLSLSSMYKMSHFSSSTHPH